MTLGLWEGWVQLMQDLGVLVGTVTAVLVFSRTWWMPWWRLRKAERAALRALPATIAKHVEAFDKFRDEVTHEIRPNNSSSIRDAIDRIERTGRSTADTVYLLQGMIRHRADTDTASASVECDGAGLVVWANATFLRWTAMQLDHVIGWGWINTVSHVDRARLRDEWEDALAESRDYTGTYGLITPDGVVQVEAKATPLRDANGNVVKWLSTIARIPAAD
jgi:PAS domain-containing protein